MWRFFTRELTGPERVLLREEGNGQSSRRQSVLALHLKPGLQLYFLGALVSMPRLKWSKAVSDHVLPVTLIPGFFIVVYCVLALLFNFGCKGFKETIFGAII